MYTSRDDFVTCRSFDGIPGDMAVTAITSTHARFKNLSSALANTDDYHVKALAANPSVAITDSMIAGTADTFMRSDAAPALSNTGVEAGEYNNATITVDSHGRITNASNGEVGVGDTAAHEMIVFYQHQKTSQDVSHVSPGTRTIVVWDSNTTGNGVYGPYTQSLTTSPTGYITFGPGEYIVVAHVGIKDGTYSNRIAYTLAMYNNPGGVTGSTPSITIPLGSSTYYRGSDSRHVYVMAGNARIIVPVGSTKEYYFGIDALGFSDSVGNQPTDPNCTYCHITKILRTTTPLSESG